MFIVLKININQSSPYFNTLFTYYLRKFCSSNLFPVTKSTAFKKKLAPNPMQLIMKKNKVCKWNPYIYLLWVYLIKPAIRGKAPKAKFWIIYIIPNPVPKSFGFTNIGIVGTITVQKMATQTPNRPEGMYLTHSYPLKY